nr:hypothetical protein [Tanacetum cinerariifolium]
MPPKPMSEARMREIIRDQVTTSMAKFMENMNHEAGGAEAGGTGASGAKAGGEKVDDRGILSSKCVVKAGARIVQLEVKRD